MKPKTYIVAKQDDRLDLLSFLAQRLDISRKKAKQLLDARSVFVNQRRIWMARHVLLAGHEVTVTQAPVRAESIKIPVLLEERDFLVVNKPAGYLSNGKDSVEVCLQRQRHEPELRVAHRLDRDTTGCLLVARSEAAKRALVTIFTENGIRKSYHVIVSGRLTAASRTIKNAVDGKHAVSHFKTLDAAAEASHLQVRIDTGRTHQIRQHLADLKHPVIGDSSYGTRRRAGIRGLHVARQMLHASELAFHLPDSGRPIRVRAPLPADFRRCLRAFGLT